MEPEAIAPSAARRRPLEHWLVLLVPLAGVARGWNERSDTDLKLVTKLPYAILNKLRLSYIYDFN